MLNVIKGWNMAHLAVRSQIASRSKVARGSEIISRPSCKSCFALLSRRMLRNASFINLAWYFAICDIFKRPKLKSKWLTLPTKFKIITSFGHFTVVSRAMERKSLIRFNLSAGKLRHACNGRATLERKSKAFRGRKVECELRAKRKEQMHFQWETQDEKSAKELCFRLKNKILS